MTTDMETHAEQIATLNDRFRGRLHIPQFGNPDIPGLFCMTRGFTTLPPVAQIEILAAVRSFDQFSEDNDPHGEHDFGSVNHAAATIFWKIDYYADSTCSFGSEAPHDVTRSFRVLTIMLADEW
ncbi:MAG: hypothetical protein QOH65_1211 [Methylobacteriaceae bacterium]|jgi:hypothetical protein|nr:hypothetical protein [Methylobacteriaceae bacterium]